MRIRWTKKAKCDLNDVEACMARHNPDAAIRTVLTVIRAVEQLTSHPHLGRPGRLSGTRELIVAGTPFIVPYRINRNVVEVLRVLQGMMKWP